MDPEAALNELRAIVHRRLMQVPEEGDDDRAAELFDGLDQWLTKGGFLPQDWRH